MVRDTVWQGNGNLGGLPLVSLSDFLCIASAHVCSQKLGTN